jgi:hypothetical protein
MNSFCPHTIIIAFYTTICRSMRLGEGDEAEKEMTPFAMIYRRLCEKTGTRHDPCVIDVFMSVTEFLKGGTPRPWWDFTEARKNIALGKVTQ